MNTPLSSFTALVKFKFDRESLTTEIASVRKQLQNLTGKTLGVKLKYDKSKLDIPSFVNQTVKLKYVGNTPSLAPLVQSRVIRSTPLPTPEVSRRKVDQPLSLKLSVGSLSLKDVKLTHVPKVKLQASTLSLKDVKLIYVPKVKPQTNTDGINGGRKPTLTQQQKLDDKVARDRTAAALKWQRLEERAARAAQKAEQDRLDAWYRKKEKEDQKATRDAQARRLRELRNQDAATRAQVARENSQRLARQRADAAEQARYNEWFQQRTRDDIAASNARARRRAEELRNQEHHNRIQSQRTRQTARDEARELNRIHTEALAENARRTRESLRRNAPPRQTQGGGSSGGGGNTNPWHIGTMAGGLGGLITRGNLAAVGAGAFTQQSFTQANFDIAQAPQFEFITGSAEEAAKQVAFLNKEVDRLALPLRETSNMYRQLLASTKKGLGIEKTQELFSSFSEISTMLGLSEDAQSRGLRAFGQMAS